MGKQRKKGRWTSIINKWVDIPASEWGDFSSNTFYRGRVQKQDPARASCVVVKMEDGRRYFWPGEVVMGWVEDTEKRGGNAEYVRRTDDDDENDEEQDEEDVDEFEYEYEDDASLTTASPEEPGALRNAEQEGAEAPFAALLASLRAPSCRARKGTAMHNKPLPLAAFTEIHSRSAQWLLQQHADAKQAYVNRGGEEGEQLAAIARLPALFSCVDPAVLKTEILAFKTEKDRALLMGEIIETLSRQQMAQAHEAGQPSEVGQQPRFSNTATSQILLGLARQRTADKLAVLHAKPAGTGAAKAPATGAPKAAGLPGPKPKPMPQQQQQQQAHVQRPGQGVAAGMPHIARRPLPQMPRPQQQPQQAPPIKREAPAPPAAAVNSQAAVRDAAAAAAGRAFNLTTTHRPVAAFSFPVDNPAVKCLGDGKPFLVVLNGVQAYIVPVTGLQMKPASLAGEAPSGKPAMQNAGLSRMGSGSLVRSPIKQQQSIGSSWPAQQQQHRMLNGSMAGEQRTASLPGLQGSGQLGAGARPGGGAGAAPPNQRVKHGDVGPSQGSGADAHAASMDIGMKRPRTALGAAAAAQSMQARAGVNGSDPYSKLAPPRASPANSVGVPPGPARSRASLDGTGLPDHQNAAALLLRRLREGGVPGAAGGPSGDAPAGQAPAGLPPRPTGTGGQGKAVGQRTGADDEDVSMRPVKTRVPPHAMQPGADGTAWQSGPPGKQPSQAAQTHEASAEHAAQQQSFTAQAQAQAQQLALLAQQQQMLYYTMPQAAAMQANAMASMHPQYVLLNQQVMQSGAGVMGMMPSDGSAMAHTAAPAPAAWASPDGQQLQAGADRRVSTDRPAVKAAPLKQEAASNPWDMNQYLTGSRPVGVGVKPQQHQATAAAGVPGGLMQLPPGFVLMDANGNVLGMHRS